MKDFLYKKTLLEKMPLTDDIQLLFLQSELLESFHQCSVSTCLFVWYQSSFSKRTPIM